MVRALRRGPTTATGKQVQPLLVAGVLTSGASLVSTVLVARLLSTSGYGALAKLWGLFLVLSLPGTALQVGVVRRVTAWEAAGMGRRVAGWVVKAHRFGIGFVLTIVVTIWLARGPIAGDMRLPGTSALVGVVVAGGLWILVAMDRGLLQSRQRYGSLAMNVVVEGAARTTGMIVLPAAGFGLPGAALGILFGELAALAHVRWANSRPGTSTAAPLETLQPSATETVHTGRELVADVVAAMIGMGLVAALQNADVVEFGSRSPGHSGAYAAISVPSKALVFFALLLANYLLPEASIQFRRGGRALRQLGHLLAVLALPATALLVVATVAPARFLGVVFGARYEGAAAGFASLVLAMVCLSTTILLTTYLLGVGWRWVVGPLAAATAGLVTFCSLVGRSAADTARADLAVQAALAGVLSVVLVLWLRTTARRAVPLAAPVEENVVEPLELLGQIEVPVESVP